MKTKFRYLSLVIVCALSGFLMEGTAQADPTLQDYLIQGDIASEQHQGKTAVECYEKVLKIDPDHYEACWKLASAYLDVGDQSSDKNIQQEYYEKALVQARHAALLNPRGSEGHLYLSISLGQASQDKGAKERIRVSKEVKEEAEKAVELNPNEDTGWHILGCWNRELATLNWIERKFADIFLGGIPKEASVENAVVCFKKSIDIKPQDINHHLELGITYEELNQKDLAIAEYKKALELPLEGYDDKSYQAEAAKRLRKLQK